MILEYRTKITLDKEEAGKMKDVIYLRNLQHIEEQIKVFRNIQYMESKVKVGSTTQVTITNPSVSIREYVVQKPIGEMTAKNNEGKYHKIEGGSHLLNPEFTSILGNYGKVSGVETVLNGNITYPEDTIASTTHFLESCKYAEGVTSLPSNDVILKYRSTFRSLKTRREKLYNKHIGYYTIVMNDKFLS